MEQFRIAFQEDANNKAKYLGSNEVTVETLIYSEEEAKQEAVDRMALFGVRRDFYRVPLVQGLFQYDLGTVVELQIPRFGLAAGRNGIVVGWEEDVNSNDVALIWWG